LASAGKLGVNFLMVQQLLVVMVVAFASELEIPAATVDWWCFCLLRF
jgi:hypothetical protein